MVILEFGVSLWAWEED